MPNACAQKPVSAARDAWNLPGAYFSGRASNRKLSPVDMVENTTYRLRPEPRAPFCSSTYVSIEATCHDSCAFKAEGCYIRSGFTAQLARRLDEGARRLRGIDVIRNEVALIDHAFPKRGHRVPQDGAHGGRDLRLHVGGDCPSEAAAVLLHAQLAAHRLRRLGTNIRAR